MSPYQSIKKDVLQKIDAHLPEIQQRFGIKTIGIFGSVSREEDTPDSDIDILYLFEDNRGGLRDLAGLKYYLEDLFKRETDLISINYISPLIQEKVFEDAILLGQKAVIA